MNKKIPTTNDFLGFDGAHCSHLWNSIDENWHCPACGRSKFEILRWTKRFVNKGKKCPPYYDWMAVLHNHHDHRQGYVEEGLGRFSSTLICGNCNAADGTAKRKLNLPNNFSFSPSEINEFVIAEPHEKHQIDFEKALKVFKKIKFEEEG